MQRRLEQSEREITAPVDQIIGNWRPTLLTASAPADVGRLVSIMMRDFHPAGMRPALHALGAVDLRDVLGTITIPTLLVYGDSDVRAPATIVAGKHLALNRPTVAVVMPLR